MSDEPKSCCNPNSGDEPSAARSHLPIWIVVLMLALLYAGAIYFDRHSGWFDKQVYAPYGSAGELEMYQPKSGAAAALAQGRKVYEQVCGLCHGNDGLGKPGQAPPLAGSEWVMTKGVQRLAHIPLTGVTGPLKVKGQDWNLSMAAMGAALSDADLAAVLTYVRSSWGNNAGEVTADDVKAARTAASKHPQLMTGEELIKMAE